MTDITVRRAVTADYGDLERLAALDSTRPPRGPALVAEADSRMIAALPLGSGRSIVAGRPIADPFERTAEVVALLELRARQLAEAESAETIPSGRRSPLARVRARLRRAAWA
jgi:hypothetical protein